MLVPRSMMLGLGIPAALVAGWALHAAADQALRPTAIAATSPTRTLSSDLDPAGTQPPIDVTVVIAAPLPDGQPVRVVTVPTAQGARPTASPSAPTVSGIGLGLASSRTSNATAPLPASHLAQTVFGLSVIANGDHIVIATDGSIVSVGDNTVVHGNTGDATNSGTIAIDVTDSTVTSGDSGGAATAVNLPEDDEGGVVDGDAPWGCTVEHVGARPIGHACENSTVVSADHAPDTRAIGIAGWDNRSIQVAGGENLVSYDGSHVFYERAGQLNSNTGDVRTSGLNVVDSTGSWVRSGDSGVVVGQSHLGAPGGTPSADTVAAAPIASASGAFVSVVGNDSIAAASGDDVLVIGGDGVRDRALTINGFRNVVTTEDGSVAIGGTGDVNAQGGDSESGGAVVMAIHNSQIEAGDALAVPSTTSATQT